MKHRIAAAVGLTLAVSAFTAPLSALADPTTPPCAVRATLPARITLDKTMPDASITIADPTSCLSDNNGGADFAVVPAAVTDPRQYQATEVGGDYYSAAGTYVLPIADVEVGQDTQLVRPGSYVARFWAAWSASNVSGTDSNVTTAKWGTKLAATQAVRTSSSYVRVSTAASRYRNRGYIPLIRASVSIQAKTSSGWKTVKTVLTDTHGRATAKIKAGVHTWRAKLLETGTTWSSASANHKA